MLYVYCPRPSNGALDLVKAIGAKRLRRFDGMDFWNKKERFKLNTDDVILCWGTSVPELENIRVLNGYQAPINKYDEIVKLAEHYPTLTHYASSPNRREEVLIPRRVCHAGGRDLLQVPDLPDYYVLRENFIQEYRIHSFAGKSIKAGVKVPREGFEPCLEADWKPDSNLYHPWIRSHATGWRVKYDEFKSTNLMRQLAHGACKVLGLTFGAVDLAETDTGIIKILEVNRAPGCDPNTINAYVRAIKKWVGPKEEKDEAGTDGEGVPEEVNALL